ncbi:MAG: SLC13/DASS family transporter [Planctomycetales bacterium]|nr:SLC13/DASS family transporter [Planctomycetales bacterium]
MSEQEPASNQKIAWFGLVAGPMAFLLCVNWLPIEFLKQSGADTIPTEFTWAGRGTLGAMAWMGIWWLTEAVHISATALLPIVLFPLLGIASMDETCFPYSDPLIYLYLGGFVLALSMERWGLGKRIALQTLRIVGTSGSAMIGGFMLVTAVLSAFVSNTATTAMMLPIALSVVSLVRNRHDSNLEENEDCAASHLSEQKQFGSCLLLAIAYSASIGGIATIIGTPTNAFLVGFLRKDISEPFRYDFSFASWLPIGLSFTLLLLPTLYFLLTRVLFQVRNVSIDGGKELIDRELSNMGGMKIGEWNTLIVFCLAVVLWLTRPLLRQWEIHWGDEMIRPLAGIDDSAIAMLGALLLFMIPVDLKKREFTMNWQTANKMPWGILILFGGGLSLASAIEANGVAEFIGSQAQSLGELPLIGVVLVVTTTIVFLTELTSNAATVASLVPVFAALAIGLGIHPFMLVIPATISASCAFMLPVATPPNAIVFGSGLISSRQMMRVGFWLNLISIVYVVLVSMIVIRPWIQAHT